MSDTDAWVCEHLGFEAEVSVGRITAEEQGKVKAFIAQIKVRCAQCQVQMQFVGVPMGLSYEHPTVDLLALQLDAPIRPLGEVGYVGEGLLGFNVTVTEELS